MFSPIFAAAGTGKLPIFPLIWSVRPAIAGPVVGTADDTIGTGLLLDEAELAAGELEVAELADGVPAEHAATDKLAAQAVRASAAERYFFIGFLHSVHKSQVPTLNALPTRRARFAVSPGLTSA
jgi:hypothetical protein